MSLTTVRHDSRNEFNEDHQIFDLNAMEDPDRSPEELRRVAARPFRWNAF